MTTPIQNKPTRTDGDMAPPSTGPQDRASATSTPSASSSAFTQAQAQQRQTEEQMRTLVPARRTFGPSPIGSAEPTPLIDSNIRGIAAERTLLMRAAERRNRIIARERLEQDYGALMLAARQGAIETVQALIYNDVRESKSAQC